MDGLVGIVFCIVLLIGVSVCGACAIYYLWRVAGEARRALSAQRCPRCNNGVMKEDEYCPTCFTRLRWC